MNNLGVALLTGQLDRQHNVISIATLPKGLYLVVLKSGDRQVIGKFVSI